MEDRRKGAETKQAGRRGRRAQGERSVQRRATGCEKRDLQAGKNRMVSHRFAWSAAGCGEPGQVGQGVFTERKAGARTTAKRLAFQATLCFSGQGRDKCIYAAGGSPPYFVLPPEKDLFGSVANEPDGRRRRLRMEMR